MQLELVSVANVLTETYLPCLSNENVLALINTLENSIEFARKFNADRCVCVSSSICLVWIKCVCRSWFCRRLREALWRAGFMKFARRNKLPLLLRQETTAANQLLALLLRLYTNDEASQGASKPAIERRRMVVSKLLQ